MAISKQGLVIGATAAMLTAFAVNISGIYSPGKAFFKESPKQLVDEVWQVIDRSYVDGTFNQVDWQNIRKEYLSRTYTTKQDAYKAIRQMLEKLEDPYTRFMDPEEFKSLQVETSGELSGIGIQIAPDEKTKRITVIAPMEGTPAAAAGILAKDIITKINDKSTQGMNINEAVSLIRGKPGTEVNITILRNKQQRQFRVKRAKIELHPVRYSYQNSPNGGTGYIRLNQFSANASSEMRNAIKDLEKKNVAGYILDLRSNPGGLLYSSIEIAQMWLDEGTIVSTVDRRGTKDLEKANNRALTDKPVVVLVDGGSASASEILSGALQDNKRGVLVGTKTFGKGLVQSVRSLGDGESGMAVTIAKYFTPNGRDINKAGIKPDVVLELTEKQKEKLVSDRTKVGTPGDPQYDKALSVLTKQIAAQRSPRAEAVR
ncbi:carboxyl-terminal processing protease CtpC [Synechocystis sp. PCC 7509]|uniref:carboxyl-terminal processing protease CtpC n=1 Tax=Synechocystis sp. PCC 7509 TaxID=927677 RepID=UPI0002ABE1B8|nr:carboxyl-terminal processing protease CtpC [Synechocystis sp. PCC 7509]